MNHRFQRILPASLVSLALVAATMTGGCNDEPGAQLALAVTTTERPDAEPDDAPLGSDRDDDRNDARLASNDIRENDPLPPPAGDAQPAPDGAAASDLPPSFTQPQLESMVAPIALYPDPLLMQILMAATYPTEVVQAAAWVKENPGLNGKELDAAIADKRWDVSVNSLTHAPKALELLAADPNWMQDLGDAFLAQQDDVLNAVQVMRVKACDLGNLKTTEQQKVVIEDRTATPEPASSYVVPPPSRVVRIEPIQPETVYVPQYNPTLVYGYAPPTYYYPTIYSYPYYTAIVAPVITFGVGLAIGGFLWGDCDWHYHRVYARPYYRDRYIGHWWWNGRYGGYNDFYRAGFARDYYWRHDLDHRRGVRYVNRDVERFYSVRGRDPYRFHDNDYRYDRRKASRGDYDRMPGFRDGRDGSRGDVRDGSRGDSRDWREKAREDAREKMQRDSEARGDRRPGDRSKDGDRGGDRGGPGGKDSAVDRDGNRGGRGKDSAVDRGGDKKGPQADRGGGGKGSQMDRGGSKGSGGASKGSSADRGGGGKGSQGGKVDRPSGGGGRGGNDRGPSMKQGGSSQRGGSSKGGAVDRGGSSQRGGGSSKGGSVQRGGGGSSKGGSVQRGGGGSSQRGGGSSMQRGGGGGGGRSGGSSMQRGGGGSSQRGGGSQGGRSGGSSRGGGGSKGGGGGGDRGKGGRN